MNQHNQFQGNSQSGQVVGGFNQFNKSHDNNFPANQQQLGYKNMNQNQRNNFNNNNNNTNFNNNLNTFTNNRNKNFNNKPQNFNANKNFNNFKQMNRGNIIANNMNNNMIHASISSAPCPSKPMQPAPRAAADKEDGEID